MFVVFAMAHAQFQPIIASLPAMVDGNGPHHTSSNQGNVGAARADEVDEVGVLQIKNSPGKKPVVIGWNFIFPLEGFRNPKFELSVKTKLANTLFGRVVHHQMLGTVGRLSTIPNAERKNLTLTLEAR